METMKKVEKILLAALDGVVELDISTHIILLSVWKSWNNGQEVSKFLNKEISKRLAPVLYKNGQHRQGTCRICTQASCEYYQEGDGPRFRNECSLFDDPSTTETTTTDFTVNAWPRTLIEELGEFIFSQPIDHQVALISHLGEEVCDRIQAEFPDQFARFCKRAIKILV